MIIGDNKDVVIANIEKSATQKEFHNKVEVNDPHLTQEQEAKLLYDIVDHCNSIKNRISNLVARAITRICTRVLNRTTKIEGIENIKEIKSGAIVTSNHFNPLDNTVVRKTIWKSGHNRLFIVSQETNFAVPGIIGFLMKYSDTIPISNSKQFMNETFPELIEKKLDKGQFILIYPEQEMWFNYRKPRPPKRGAYYYAAKKMVPVVSCFVEIRDLVEKETEEFYRTQYIMHVLKPIYPDPSKSIRENSIMLMKQDYAQKVEAYEKAYGKKLDYEFSLDDIAGWISRESEEVKECENKAC